MLRKPAVAGRFYPLQADQLAAELSTLIDRKTELDSVFGVVVPHAGYMYSGHVAGAVYSRIRIPTRNIVLCSNHTGYGQPLSIMSEGVWQMPLGEIPIDSKLSEALMDADPDLKNDVLAHRFEHATEVQLPFLQHLAPTAPLFVPITIGSTRWNCLEKLGLAIAKVIGEFDDAILIVASSDMNHYESDEVTRFKDSKAIEQILAMNPEGLYEIVERERISMCGYGPTVAMLVAANRLGASRAELIKYSTSAEVSGNFERVVGYAGLTIA